MTGTNGPIAKITRRLRGFGCFCVRLGVCVHCAMTGHHVVVGVLVVAVVIAARLRPVSFSNPVAKVVCADGTALGGVWESRLLPPCFLVCVGCYSVG